MTKQLSIIEFFATAIASITIASISLILSLKVASPPVYSDFIVGNITWSDSDKLQDLLAMPVFILTSFISFNIFVSLIRRLKNNDSEKYSRSFSVQLIWWSLPTIAAMFSQILGGWSNENLFPVSAVGIIFISVASRYQSPKILGAEALGLNVLAILFLSLIPLEAALILGRASVLVIDNNNVSKFASLTYLTAALGLIATLILALRSPHKFSRFLPKLLFLSQIGLPFIFLTLYPAKLLQQDGSLTQYETTIWLKILVSGLILLGLSDLVLRYRRNFETKNLTALLSPVALFSLLVGLKLGNTFSPNISPDDYHFGEQLIGWWSYIYGKIPYIDYIPPHGLIDNDLSLFLSSIFYDSSAASIAEASRLSFALLAFVAFVSIYYFSNSVGLAFVSIFFLVGGRLSFLFLTPFLCLWFSFYLRENPSKWLSVWILTAPFVILGVPPQGLLLVASSAVMAIYFARRFLHCDNRNWSNIGGSLFILSISLLVTPLGVMLFGATRYVLENSSINQIAYGIPWHLSWQEPTKSGFLFEIVRMSWAAIPLACLLVIYILIKDKKNRNKEGTLPIIVVLIFILLLIPYSMGRIDPGGVSRPGLVSIFGWAILFPISLWHLIKPIHRTPLVLLVASMCAALNFSPLSFSNLGSVSSSQINTPMLRDGQSFGLPNLGKVYVQEDHWDRLYRLNKLLDEKILPGETYLDLTSRNAQYFYFNRRPLVSITAPYNMASLVQQKRVVQKLSSNLPRIALLEGSNINHDGGGLALRNPYLYRFVVENYIPRYEEGFTIGYSKKHWQDKSKSEIQSTPKNLTDLSWERGIHRSEAAIISDDPELIGIINPGDQIVLSGGDVRKVKRVESESNVIWLDGNSLESKTVGHPDLFRVPVTPESLNDYRDALFQRAFSQSFLHKIPISWGRSLAKLERKMDFVKSLDIKRSSLKDFTKENGFYKVAGDDPSISFDANNLGLSGQNAGLLRFNFSCIGKISDPTIQVFWWGDHHLGAYEKSSLKFTAGEGVMIVPLDSSSYWVNQKIIHGIRIDLDNANACQKISITNLELLNRNFK
ncbi:hypothetical protein [Nodosilinea sp. E11]|uniref:hypothetical protein n=1 Tax=Nodosilinea sp. E11 TaxID=3037479 RepID=UPI002934DF34|nr:hypothetical protein [Nodosilinea sp. E11]